VTRVAVSSSATGRQPRHAWARNGYAHIDVGHGSPLSAAQAATLEEAAESVKGVAWAAYNGVLGRVVVKFDPAVTGLSAITAVVESNEPHSTAPARKPWKLDAAAANAVALGADLLSAGLGAVGRLLRRPPLPAELAAAPAAVDVVPGLAERLQSLLGKDTAELGTTLFSSLVNAGTQMSLATVSDAALRTILLAESWAHRAAWAARAGELHPDQHASRADPIADVPRPVPLTDGPIERYAQRLGTVALLAAGGLAVLPTTRRRAAQAIALGSGRSARLGREAYAGRLGRLLARRGVVVRDPEALRRLDRIRTVVVDAAVLVTGRLVIREVMPLRGSEDEARERAASLLGAAPPDLTRSGSAVRLNGWMLGAAPTTEQLPPEARIWLDERSSRQTHVLALTKGRSLVALVHVEAELDPLCAPLIATARKVGEVLLAGAQPELAKRVRADGTVPGGSRLASSIRALQRGGSGVALVAARNDTALGCADCGIGVLGEAHRPPWGAHILVGPGLESVWLVLESACLANGVSGRSARLSLLGSVAGALLALVDQTEQAGRRALTAAGSAGVATLICGLWSARTLNRLTPPVPEGLVPWHSLPIAEVFRLVDSSPAGLSNLQAQQRRGTSDGARDGGRRGILRAALAELDTPLTAPLAAGAGVSAAVGSTTDAILVLAVILANALLSAAQELTAGRAMRRLLTAGALQARLCRDGDLRMVAADNLVTGDVVCLEAGDAIPADCRLITTSGLAVDESPLTGESVPVDKDLTPTMAAAVADRTCMVYESTTVVAGTGTAVVVATGRATEAGRSASMAVEAAPEGGVQARLRTMTEASIPISAAAAAAVLLGGLVRGRMADSVSSAVALAVAAIPEGLPFVATAAELSASKKLARHNILVRNRRAMEALGRVDVICFDKTGTLTEGRIRMTTISDGCDHHPVEQATLGDRRIIAAALRASPPRNGDDTLPHPTDQAVVEGGERASVTANAEAAGWRNIRELPFEPGRGFHAVLGHAASGQMISVKGAPEVVLPRCVAWCRDGTSMPLTATNLPEIYAEIDRLARQGLRVLAVAERRASRRRHFDEERVDRLEFLGLLGLADTTRPSAAEAVRRLRAAGIKVVMLTGDHPSTAEAIGAELDLIDGGSVVTGPELDDADVYGQDALVAKASVIARVSPAHKVAVVRAMRRAGHVVAVTGDGANDAPAIRLADVGIALGDQGTAAARQASDMIVVDGRIETIADAVIAGRAMWASVRDALSLLLGGNLGEILFTVGSSALSAQPPLNTRQILFVNLMTDLLPALTVASRTPRNVTLESLAKEGPELSLGAGLSQDVAQRAVATALSTTGGWLAARFTGTPARASSVAVGSLVASQLTQTLVASRGDPAVLLAVGASAAALVAAVQTPGISQFFGSRPLGPVGWSIVGGAAVAGAVLGALPAAKLSGLTDLVERLHTRGQQTAAP
jgi:cation-transporting ATPase I